MLTLSVPTRCSSVLSQRADWASGFSSLHRLGETVETGTDAAVDQLAAQLDDEAAEDGGVDGRGDSDVAADTGFEVLGQLFDLRGAERVRAGDLRGHLAAVVEIGRAHV